MPAIQQRMDNVTKKHSFKTLKEAIRERDIERNNSHWSRAEVIKVEKGYQVLLWSWYII